MKALEEIKQDYIKKTIDYYNSDKRISISECAKKFNMSRDTLTKYLKEQCSEHYIHKYNVDETYFSKIDSEEKAYWLGFLTADGCIFKNRPSIRLALSEKDYAHVEKFKKALKSDHTITIVPAGGYTDKNGKHSMAASITIQNKKLYNDLINLGFTSAKSLNEKPVELPENLIPHYIRGIFDGDGWISFSDKHRDLGFGMGKEILIYIKNNFEKYGNVKNSYNVRYFKKIYRYRISSKIEILKALDFMYNNATIFLDRKYEKYLEFKEYCRSQSKDIEG